MVTERGMYMDFQSLVAQRYSCRDMDGSRVVEQEKVEQILRAAQLAPSACNLQRYHIKVIQTKEALEKLRPLTPCHFNAPLVFVLSVIADGGEKIQDTQAAYRFAMIDAGIVVVQMALQAQELGLGTTIVGMFDAEQLQEQFAIPEEQTPVLLLPTGYPGEKGGPCILHKQRKKVAETVEWL